MAQHSVEAGASSEVTAHTSTASGPPVTTTGGAPADAPTAPAGDFHNPAHWASLTGGDMLEVDDVDSAISADIASSTESMSSSILHYRTINGRTYHSERGNAQYW